MQYPQIGAMMTWSNYYKIYEKRLSHCNSYMLGEEEKGTNDFMRIMMGLVNYECIYMLVIGVFFLLNTYPALIFVH